MNAGLSLPQLIFLHGNVKIGFCEQDKRKGLTGARCSKCGETFKRVPLLYPIRQKNYSENTFITTEWKALNWALQNAFMVTVFGYSAPATDTEAKEMMLKGWGSGGKRNLEQTAFISFQEEGEIYRAWKSFIHSHHYEVHRDFYDSWIAKHPRRTGEAYWAQYLEAKFIDSNPIPSVDFPELWNWYSRFKQAEDQAQSETE
ncbi:MAG: hypothetical protein DMG65_03310 [Candidatus Angelobacter sp. Gp1-AA117]|nr:MAG: hypothetical protein DMG65_03310 [Candidatus Angelobacter sp. Gp1-AA117]